MDMAFVVFVLFIYLLVKVNESISTRTYEYMMYSIVHSYSIVCSFRLSKIGINIFVVNRSH